MTDATKLIIAKYVNYFTFKNVWGEPRQEYRHNLKLSPISNLSSMNTIQLAYNTTVQLPLPNKVFKVFIVARALFAGIAMDFDEWSNLQEYINDTCVDIRVHLSAGQWCHRNKIWVRNNPTSDTIIFAIEKDMLNRIDYSNGDTVFVSPYYRDKTESTIVIDNILVDNPIDIPGMVTLANAATVTYLNGRNVHDITSGDLVIGDYIETIVDSDTMLNFTVDIALNDPNRTYVSEVDGRQRHIIRYPTDLGVKNINHNIIDMFVRPRNTTDVNLKGLFLHRGQGAGNSTWSVTRNTCSIPHYILVDYMSKLGVDEIEIFCMYRVPNDDIDVYQDDVDYTQYLDLLPHDIVMEFLDGNMRHHVDFWNSEHLEQSEYTKRFLDCLTDVSITDFESFLKVYGYYSLISIICPRTYNDPVVSGNVVWMRRPTIYSDDSAIRILPYVNNKYVKQSAHGILTFDDDIRVTMIPSVIDTDPYNFDAEIYEENGSDEVQIESLSAGNNNILVNYPDVYVEMYTGTGSNRELDNAFKHHLAITHPDETHTNIEIDPDLYGRDLFIYPSQQIHIQEMDLQPLIDEKVALRVPISIDVVGGGTHIPGEFSNVVVHLNGSRLIKGIDFYVYIGGPLFDDNFIVEDTLNHYIVISNREYLDPTTNTIELFMTRDKVVHTSTGFLNSQDNPLQFWKNNLSTISVHGEVYTSKSTDNLTTKAPDTIEYPDNHAGHIYHVSTVIPASAVELLKEWDDGSDDDAKFSQIQTYFNGLQNITPQQILIQYSHKLFSPLLATIIYRLSKGTMVLDYDPVMVNMLQQIVLYYKLMIIDNGVNDIVDNRFIDTYPHYINIGASSVPNYMTLEQLMLAVMDRDELTDGDYINIPLED